jgi:hypothetical protein
LELDQLRSLDVVLPVRRPDAAPLALRLRVVARPEPALAQLLARLGLELPQRPKIVEPMENVVPKNALSKTQLSANQATPCDY